jgi:hypothetical protein
MAAGLVRALLGVPRIQASAAVEDGEDGEDATLPKPSTLAYSLFSTGLRLRGARADYGALCAALPISTVRVALAARVLVGAVLALCAVRLAAFAVLVLDEGAGAILPPACRDRFGSAATSSNLHRIGRIWVATHVSSARYPPDGGPPPGFWRPPPGPPVRLYSL